MTEKELAVWEAAMELAQSLEAWDAAQALKTLEDDGGTPMAVGIKSDSVRLILRAVDDDAPVCGRFILEPGMADEFLGLGGN